MLPLTTCFRCCPEIIGAANALLIGKANSAQCDEFTPYVLRSADGAPAVEVLNDSLLDSRAWETEPGLIIVLGRTRRSLLLAMLELTALDEPPIVQLNGKGWAIELRNTRELFTVYESELEEPGTRRVLHLEPFAHGDARTWSE